MTENEEYWLTDLESGIPYKVTKEHYDSFHNMWESVKPKLNNNSGTVIITSTPSGDNNFNFEELWKNQ